MNFLIRYTFTHSESLAAKIPKTISFFIYNHLQLFFLVYT